ncbi:MAG: YggS family pyridoxal phosphate-dependent enzyme, partial [Gammaproteobacteria bacterium]
MSISKHIFDLKQRVANAAQRAHRRPDEIRLVAASKSHGVESIACAARRGITDFGENYVNEALPKIAALATFNLTWHFIGAIQSNKTAAIARSFQWVQTVDRVKIAQRLSAQRPTDAGPLDVLIQINIDHEPRKAGISPEGLAEFAAQLLLLPRLRLRGLMAIPRPVTD